MKKKQHFANQQWFGIKKLLLVMKLTALFLFLSVMAIASGTYGQETRFDLNVKNATVIQVFDEIERVTEFGFLFKTDQLDLNRHFTLDIKKANIDQILNEVLERVYRKKPPFSSVHGSSDKGFKDTLLWMSIIHYFEKFHSNVEVTFITSDKGFISSETTLKIAFLC